MKIPSALERDKQKHFLAFSWVQAHTWAPHTWSL